MLSEAPLGLADITVAKELSHDYAGTLKQAAAMGYSHFGFRLAGLFAKRIRTRAS